MHLFLALPSKLVNVSAVRNAKMDCQQFIAALRDLRFQVECPLEEVDFTNTIPAEPTVTLALRLKSIEEADCIIAMPCVGHHKSSGVIGFIYWAVAKNKRVIVLHQGSNDLEIPWQLTGLRDNPAADLSIVYFQDNLQNAFLALAANLTPPKRTAEAPASIDSNCPYGSEYQRYWNRRHELFHLWQDGMEGDAIGLCTVKPERCALDIARSLQGRVVLDAFAGVGGMSIALARVGKRVIAVDTNINRLTRAKQNAVIYGVESHINFIHGDVCEVSRHMQYDSMYIDPPWGGPSYMRRPEFSFLDFEIDGGHKVQDLLQRALLRDLNVAMSLPLNFDIQQFNSLIQELNRQGERDRAITFKWHNAESAARFLTAYCFA
jgi:trimethylguanosine synthase